MLPDNLKPDDLLRVEFDEKGKVGYYIGRVLSITKVGEVGGSKSEDDGIRIRFHEKDAYAAFFQNRWEFSSERIILYEILKITHVKPELR